MSLQQKGIFNSTWQYAQSGQPQKGISNLFCKECCTGFAGRLKHCRVLLANGCRALPARVCVVPVCGACRRSEPAPFGWCKLSCVSASAVSPMTFGNLSFGWDASCLFLPARACGNTPCLHSCFAACSAWLPLWMAHPSQGGRLAACMSGHWPLQQPFPRDTLRRTALRKILERVDEADDGIRCR